MEMGTGSRVVTMESYRKWDMGHLGAVGVRRHRGGSYRPRPRAPEFRTMNRTIRLCALAGSDGIAIPAPFVDVRCVVCSADVPSRPVEKGTCSRSELEAFSQVNRRSNAVTHAVSNPLSSGIQLTESIDEI